MNQRIQTSLDTSGPATLVDGLRRWARLNPDRVACTFLPDRGEPQSLTFEELDRRARTVAVTLSDCGAVGERVLLLYPPGLDYVTAFFGCLYAGVVAVPLYPPDPSRLDRTLGRLRAIARDAEPTLALTTTPIRTLAQGLLSRAPELAELRWMATDPIDAVVAERFEPTPWEPDRLAFLQYTSGSTGQPKGVMLTHDNLHSNMAAIVQAFRMRSEDRVVSWLPPYHDMGLIGTIMLPMYVGAEVILMSPIAFLRQPYRWLEAVTRYRATVTGGPNFGYSLSVRKIPPALRESIDLSTLEVAFVGAEPVRASTLADFAEAFGPRGFRIDTYSPCYGLAESSLLVSASLIDAPGRGGGYRSVEIDKAAYERGVVQPATEGAASVSLVGSGQTPDGVMVRIVDPDTRHVVPEGSVGEVWIAGGSVASGYWEREQEDPGVFDARIVPEPDDDEPPPDQGFLRSGDLGFLRNGELFICGRRKDLIVIHGRNLHPQDIEVLVESSHEQLRPGCCAAFSINDGERERLVVAIEVTTTDPDTLRAEEIHQAVQRAMSTHHGLRIDELVLLPRSTIPKTSSGKIQRRVCKAALLEGSLPRVHAPTK